MTDINSLVIVGRLTRDMEIKFTNAGMAVGNFAIAVNKSRKVGEQWQDETSFFDVTIFGKFAESQEGKLTKGKQIALTGSIKQDRWEKDGQKFSKVGIIADSIEILSRNEGGTNPAPGNKIAPAYNNEGTETEESFSEDIPF